MLHSLLREGLSPSNPILESHVLLTESKVRLAAKGAFRP